MKVRPKILVFVGYYLPAYKAGGPIRTILNMVDQLSDDFEFWIITRDRDLGGSQSFQNINLNAWNEVGDARVFYATPDRLTISRLAKLIKATSFDVLYLNSFFDYALTIKPLLAIKCFFQYHPPVVLAPRGEFSEGALNIKSFKKKMFISLSRLFCWYKGVIWQASSELEKQDVLKALKLESNQIRLAKDLPEKRSDFVFSPRVQRDSKVRLVFLSRISPMKNLDFALTVLSKIKSKLVFDIYGPIEDVIFWQRCLKLIELLPENIQVQYLGEVKPKQVRGVFTQYDLFFFPTRGENYGHVIAESLSAGTPVLISDQTPWNNLSDDALGWTFPLTDEFMFIEKIEQISGMTVEERFEWRRKVAVNSVSIINCEADISDNKALFYSMLEKNNFNEW